MALPVIIYSNSGSDTQASGAGPATAVYGTQAASSSDGLTITLTSDSPDLSGVLADGSAVLYFADSTTTGPSFVKITSVDNVNKTLGLELAVTGSLSGITWAVGGKRRYLYSSSNYCRKMFNKTSVRGDARPGWTLRMESGFTEDIGARWDITYATDGNNTDGPITLEGEAGAATMPVITSTVGGRAGTLESSMWLFQNFKWRQNNASRGTAFYLNGAQRCVFRNLVLGESGYGFTNAFNCIQDHCFNVFDCEIAYCTSGGISNTSNGTSMHVHGCYIHNITGAGISLAGTRQYQGVVIEDCVIADCSTDGINFAHTTNAESGGHLTLRGNTIYSCDGDGINIASTSAQTYALREMVIKNNICSNNTGYGLNFSGSGLTAAMVAAMGIVIANNCFYNNSGGTCNLTIASPWYLDNITTDPAFIDSANANFGVGVNMRALGHPLLKVGGGTSNTRSYVDIGAAQREEPSGSGGKVSGFNRGFN